MEQSVSENIKKIVITGIAAVVVYLVFLFVLPVLMPFLLAFCAAGAVRPAVCWMRKRLHVKESIGAVVLFLLIAAVVFWLLNLAAGILGRELRGLFDEWNQSGISLQMLPEFILKADTPLQQLLIKGIRKAGSYLTEEACVRYCMKYSGTVVGWCTGFLTGFFVFFLASILAVEEMEKLHQKLTQCAFYRDFVDYGAFLGKVCGKWLKVQGKIMLITMVLGTIGLWISGFSYALLLGIVIGVVDVLPVLGTGTVYIPWMIWEFVTGSTSRGIRLLLIYLVCYFSREFMESRWMGQCMGLTAFEFLAAVYIGLKLFGGIGFVLGPLWILTVIWFVNRYVTERGQQR